MNGGTELLDQGLAARTFALWSQYWLELGPHTPPLHLSRYTMDGGVLFFAPMGRPEVQWFLDAEVKNPELVFLMEGESLIKDHTWYGHWCAFSVKARALVHIKTHPTPVPQQPKRWPF